MFRAYPTPPPLLFFVASLLLFLAGLLRAEVPGALGVAPSSDRAWQVQSFAAAAKLERQRVFDLTFDAEGEAWFATSNGLWHYNGYSWVGYGTEEGLPSRLVRGVVWTSRGELWVATDRGAGVFTPTTRTFDRRGTVEHLPNQNVRSIQELNDGSLWFSCDQWPDLTVGPGGLARWQDNVWTVYQREQGLPSDYILGCYRTHRGEVLAFTPRGWVRQQGARWVPVATTGDELDAVIVQAAEGFDGRLFLQGENRLTALTGSNARHVSAESVLVTARRNGSLVSLLRDPQSNRIRFAEWNGADFIPASAPIVVSPRTQFLRLIEAPDGSIWCVGQGLILRWSRESRWQHYNGLPSLTALDSRGQPWFSGDGQVVWHDQLGFHRHPSFTQLAGIDREDVLLGRDGQGRWYHQANLSAKPTPVEMPLAQVYQTVNDGENRLWLVGRDAENRLSFVLRNRGRWETIFHPDFANRRVLGVQPGEAAGLYVLVTSSNQLGYALLQVEPTGVTPFDLGAAPPEITAPSFTIRGKSLVLCGHSAAYEMTAQRTWQKLEGVKGNGLMAAYTGNGNDLVVAYQNDPQGRSGLALRRDGHWTYVLGAFDQVFPDPRTRRLLATGPATLWRQRDASSLDFDTFMVPEEVYISRATLDADGRFWMNTTEGVFSRSQNRRAPIPLVTLAAERVPFEATLEATFSAVEFLSPTPVTAGVIFSYRLDAHEFSPWLAAGKHALPLSGLEAGPHVIEVRAQNTDGVASTQTVALSFVIQPIPLQNRDWFVFAVVFVVLTLAFFVWLGITRARAVVRSHRELEREFTERERAEQALAMALAELKKAHNELEHRVAQRTLELSSANEALRTALADRELAERNRAALEHQLREAQKMEAIGTLAGGIAHDFNNILTVIMPCTSIALDDAKHIPGVRENLSQVLQAAERAKHLVQQILAFSRRQKPEQRPTDLRVLVKETHHLLRSAIPSTIAVHLRLAPEVPLVLADGTQIHQVLMNLCTNARHAVPTHGGIINIHVDTLALTPDDVRLSSDLAAGLYVRLAVEDNGRGISQEVLPRIFEPFFTTKGPGEGTGLGLSVAHGIIKDHHGTIRVFSREGHGTRFDVLLPPAQAQNVAPVVEAPSVSVGHGEQILIVDDEFMVSRIISQVLTRNGYRPSVHTRPEVALGEFLKNPKRFHLLVTDLTMPGMNGLELARAIRGPRPDLPIILMTGYAGDVPPGVEANEVDRVAYKPFEADSLVRIIEQLLNERNPQRLKRV